MDARAAKKGTTVAPVIGDALSAAKNLDEYQFRICSAIPPLPDSNPLKVQLQKYRVGIVASFARLAALLKEKEADADAVAQWSRHAKTLLEEASEAYLKASSPSAGSLQVAKRSRSAFEFFGVPEESVDAALSAFYALE